MATADSDRLKSILGERAVRFGEFTLASGRTSDFYVDIKKIFLEPEALHLLGVNLVEAWLAMDQPIDAVAGMTLGADPLISAFVLEAWRRDLRIPGIIVRKEPKAHGTRQYLEGASDLAPGSRLLILEDVVTSGGSSVRTAERCRDQGFIPVSVLAVVDRQEGGQEAIKSADLEFSSLYARSDLKEAFDVT